MTKRKDAIVRHFPPRFTSRETMAYLLDVSVDTFDRLVATGAIERAASIGGIMRWPVERVIERLEGHDVLTDEDARDRADIRAGTLRVFGQPARRRGRHDPAPLSRDPSGKTNPG